MTDRNSFEALIKNQNLKLVLGTLTSALIFLVKRLYDLDLEIEILEKEKHNLICENEKMVQMLEKSQNLEKVNKDSFKIIGGVVFLILIISVISYFGGIDPGQLGNGLNSVSNQNTDIAIESLKGLSKNVGTMGDNILKGIEELEKVIQNLNKENNSWFEHISKQIAKYLPTNTQDIFSGKKPPAFK